MNNMHKKITLYSLTAIVILSLAGCKSNKNVSESTKEKIEIEVNTEDITEETESKEIETDKIEEVDRTSTTNLNYNDSTYKIYTPDNITENGLIKVEYKGIDFGVLLITKVGTNNTYKYIIYDNNPIDVLITDGNGEYTIIGYSVTPTSSGEQSIVSQTSNISYYLLADELEIYKLSSTLVNYRPIQEYLQEKVTEIFNNNNITEESADLDKILSIFNYFTEFEYDNDLANNISNGEITKHIVNIENTINNKRGICVDTATALTAMYRSIGYPTRLVYGYNTKSSQYHSWVQVYTNYQWYTLDPIMYKDGIISDISTYTIDKIH